MIKLFYIYILVPLIALTCIVCSKQEKQSTSNTETTITLRWVKAYDNETKDKIENGLKWALLFLGAGLHEGSWEKSVVWKDNIKLDVDFSQLGFSAEGLTAMNKLIAELKKSGEYVDKGGIDIGRFIILTVNSPHHYYAITNAPKTFEDYKKRLQFDNKKAGIVESNIAFGQRSIDVPDANSEIILKHGFAAGEGHGSLINNRFNIIEREVFDIMPNGMFRFMLYDSLGNLKPAGDTSLGGAGKPSKCLWCHETVIQPAFISKTSVPGHYSPAEYEEIIKKQFDLLTEYRKSLKQDIDYNKVLDHTFTEILYISFMEPSAERLANEWGIPIEQVTEKLKSLPTHTHNEFPYLGTLYSRADIESLAPYSVIKTPTSAREPSQYEPNLIK